MAFECEEGDGDGDGNGERMMNLGGKKYAKREKKRRDGVVMVGEYTWCLFIRV